MATRRNAHGIVLRRTDFGEADRILTILTKELGKVVAIAKGARKLQSKLASGVELLSVSELGLLPGKSMYTLTSARSSQNFENIANNLAKLNITYEILQLINKHTENDEGAELYAVLEQALYGLNDISVSMQLTKTWFYVQLLSHFGQQPNLTHDANGVLLAKDLTYILQPSSGSLIPSENEQAVFNESSIKSLRLMTTYDPRQLTQINGVEESIIRVADSIEAFVRYQLG